MPSTDAPTHYDRSNGTMSGRTDAFFKWYSPEFVYESTGDMESALGYVQLLCVEREDIVDYVQEHGDPWISDQTRSGLKPGWYITRQDSNGLIWAMCYGDVETHPEELARADFAEARAVYAEWEEEEEIEDIY